MNTLIATMQSTLTDTLRLSLLHNITSGKQTNSMYDTLYMGLSVIVLTVLSAYISENSISFSKLYDSIWMCFYRKHSFKLKGQSTTSTQMYNGKTFITTFYTDTFRAIWGHIMQNIHANNTIYELQEIKTTVRVATDDDCPMSKLKSVFIVSQKNKFLIDEPLEIYAYLKESTDTSDEKSTTKTELYEITLYSYKTTASGLLKYVEEMTQKYLAELAESRYGKRYMYTLTKTDYSSSYDLLQCWRENCFCSSKTFDNVFFENKHPVIRKIDFFINNREWYDKHGIPYTLGIGLYGPPGTGKTSFIKALANYVGDRHLINMPMALIKTKKQLYDLYYESRYNELNLPNTVDFAKKIIVIEDIDCAGDIVMERAQRSTHASPSTNKSTNSNDGEGVGVDTDYTEITLSDKLNHIDDELKTTIRENIANESRKLLMKMSPNQHEDNITLDDILNLWDGIRETPGRILVISSNFYDKLDSAIRRPGRIDITLGMTNASHEIIREMFMHFYGTPIDESSLSKITPGLYSPAEITNLYIMYREDATGFMTRLCENKKVT
jgi:DNA replication protein DnaC